MPNPCRVCGSPVPPSRSRYCSALCLRKATNLARRGRFNIDVVRVKHDGRVKLTDAMPAEIKELGALGWPLRKLARRFEVHHLTVKAVLDPAWYAEKQRKRYSIQPWREYYDKERHRLAMRKTRAKKRAQN